MIFRAKRADKLSEDHRLFRFDLSDISCVVLQKVRLALKTGSHIQPSGGLPWVGGGPLPGYQV